MTKRYQLLDMAERCPNVSNTWLGWQVSASVDSSAWQ